MQRNNISQNQKQKAISAVRPTGVADLSRSRSNFRPLPTEVAKRAYFNYLNEGSIHGRDEKHWLEAEAQLFAEIDHEMQIHRH